MSCFGMGGGFDLVKHVDIFLEGDFHEKISNYKYIEKKFFSYVGFKICVFEKFVHFIFFTPIGLNLFAINFCYLLNFYRICIVSLLFPLLTASTLSFFIIAISRSLSIVLVILKHQLLALLNFSVIFFYYFKFCSKQYFIYIPNLLMYFIFITIKVKNIF